MVVRLPALASRRPRPARRGFTFIEAAFVTMIAGFVTIGMLQLMSVGTFANKESAELTTAINLADNIHEATMTKTFAQTVAMNGSTYSPPVDSQLTYITALGSQWKQTIAVSYVTPGNITTTSGTATETAKVTVTVQRNNQTVHTISWVIGKTS